jgi:predicted dehydrogenase
MIQLKKVFFLGLGGAGQRHLRVIKRLCPEAQLSAFRSTGKTPLLTSGFQVDAADSIEKKYDVELIASIDEGLRRSPDLVVISTPTSKHMRPALQALEAGAHVFVEKPFSHDLEGFDQLEKLARSQNRMVATSFQRRFNPHFQILKKAIESRSTGRIASVVFNVSSYLPSWHPYEDFRDMYASRKELGGGVLLTEIHEIDLCCWFFGLPQTVFCTGGSLSGAGLEVEDTVALSLSYEGFVVSLNLGFMNRKTRRELQINASQCSFEWNENQNQLKTFNHEKGDETVVSAPFQNSEELFEKQFQDLLQKGLSFRQADFEKAKMSVQVVEAAKASMRSGQAVRI